MSVREMTPDASRLIAQQHCAPEGVCGYSVLPQPLEQWEGFWKEIPKYLGTTKGFKDGICKTTYHAVGLQEQFGVAVSPQMKTLSFAAKGCKNALGAAELPGKVTKAVDSWDAVIGGIAGRLDEAGDAEEVDGTKVHKAFINTLGIVNPAVDLTESLQAFQVIQLPPEVMAGVGRLNAAALLVSMTDGALRDIYTIGEAYGAQQQDKPIKTGGMLSRADQSKANFELRKEMAGTVIALNLIDLAKCVSYIALASLVLIAAFFTGLIVNPGFWILLASTSALAFSIIGEITSRAYNPSYPNRLELPQVTNEGAAEESWVNKWDWAGK
jgi:hypothetical protein